MNKNNNLTKPLSIRFNKEDFNRLKEIADREERSYTGLIRLAIKDYIEAQINK